MSAASIRRRRATHQGARPSWRNSWPRSCERSAARHDFGRAATGDLTLAACLRGGAAAGLQAAAALGFSSPAHAAPHADDEPARVSALWRVEGARTKAFVDLQNDVTVADVEIAHREGFRSVEHLKRYTTLGMATDQGKTANLNGHALMAMLTGRTVAETGTTMARPPHLPVAIGALAGRHRGRQFKPTRPPPRTNGRATMVEAAMAAPAMVRAPGERLDLQRNTRGRARCAQRRDLLFSRWARSLQGADAVVLPRRAASKFRADGRKGRYGGCCASVLVMDGTGRVRRDKYVVSTTTPMPKVMQHLEFCHQVLWPRSTRLV